VSDHRHNGVPTEGRAATTGRTSRWE